MNGLRITIVLAICIYGEQLAETIINLLGW